MSTHLPDDCKLYQELLSTHYTALSQQQRQALENHLQNCSACTLYKAESGLLCLLLNLLPVPDMEPGLPPQLEELLSRSREGVAERTQILTEAQPNEGHHSRIFEHGAHQQVHLEYRVYRHVQGAYPSHKVQCAYSRASLPETLDEVQFTGTLQGSTSEDTGISELRPNGQRTWNKVVEPSLRRQSHIYSARPPEPDNERMQVSATHVSVTPLSQSSSTLEAFKRSTVALMKRTSPKVIFWISTTLLLLSVSLFGITTTFAHRQASLTNADTRLSLQITPNELSFGATMNLRGEHFSPYAAVGFTRDNAVPLTDTSNALFTQADRMGYFTDTIIVGNDWGTGSHVITAEDSLTHKVASFPVSISGQGIVSRPPHLHLSVSTLDFGSGDHTKTLTLLNSEGSEITWQGRPSESWLLITPREGSFTHDAPQQVTIAVDRSQLQPGSHTAKVHFSSNGGDESLAVSTEVTSLQPEHEAVMQISPAVLSFTATDGSNPPSSQQIKISNSGGQTINWSTSSDVPWLTVSRPSITIAPSTFAVVQVSVASRNSLPGTYTGAFPAPQIAITT